MAARHSATATGGAVRWGHGIVIFVLKKRPLRVQIFKYSCRNHNTMLARRSSIIGSQPEFSLGQGKRLWGVLDAWFVRFSASSSSVFLRFTASSFPCRGVAPCAPAAA